MSENLHLMSIGLLCEYLNSLGAYLRLVLFVLAILPSRWIVESQGEESNLRGAGRLSK